MERVYSGVVSSRGLWLMLLISELNGLVTWATEIGLAYLVAKTQQIYIIACPELWALEGHILVVRIALYGLRTSGLRWHEWFAACLSTEVFESCKAEPDLRIRPAADHSCYSLGEQYDVSTLHSSRWEPMQNSITVWLASPTSSSSFKLQVLDNSAL